MIYLIAQPTGWWLSIHNPSLPVGQKRAEAQNNSTCSSHSPIPKIAWALLTKQMKEKETYPTKDTIKSAIYGASNHRKTHIFLVLSCSFLCPGYWSQVLTHWSRVIGSDNGLSPGRWSLFGPMMGFCLLGHWNKFQYTLNLISPFKKTHGWKMATNLSRPQCIKLRMTHLEQHR